MYVTHTVEDIRKDEIRNWFHVIGLSEKADALVDYGFDNLYILTIATKSELEDMVNVGDIHLTKDEIDLFASAALVQVRISEFWKKNIEWNSRSE